MSDDAHVRLQDLPCRQQRRSSFRTRIQDGQRASRGSLQESEAMDDEGATEGQKKPTQHAVKVWSLTR